MNGVPALSREHFDLFDFVVIPVNHMHMAGLVRAEGVDTPEQATLLRKQVVTVDRTGVKLPDGAVFIADLIGCRALDDDGSEFGKITDVLTMPSSDVYVVKGEKTYMIPAVKAFVREINVAEGFVRVHLIEGMATDEN